MEKFDEIIARAELDKYERSKLDQLREQRQLCGEIFAGLLYHGFKISEVEERFVHACNRSMRPLEHYELSVLQKINARRWAEREN